MLPDEAQSKQAQLSGCGNTDKSANGNQSLCFLRLHIIYVLRQPEVALG